VLVALAAPLTLIVLGPIVRWPEPMVFRVTNGTDDSVLVDTRGFDGSFGVAGPIAERLAPGDTTTLRYWATSAPCIRVAEPSSGSVAARLVADGTKPGDTVSIRVLRPNGGGPPRPNLAAPCPPELADDRVRVGFGWYFEPRDPSRILRERILGTH